MNGYKISGKRLLVKYSNALNQQTSIVQNANLYIKPLPQNATEGMISFIALFSSFTS